MSKLDFISTLKLVRKHMIAADIDSLVIHHILQNSIFDESETYQEAYQDEFIADVLSALQ